jgi:hypothetical protein
MCGLHHLKRSSATCLQESYVELRQIHLVRSPQQSKQQCVESENEEYRFPPAFRRFPLLARTQFRAFCNVAFFSYLKLLPIAMYYLSGIVFHSFEIFKFAYWIA